jgi:hypothetical protein
VRGTEAGMEAKDGVELLEQIFAEGKEFGIAGQRHWPFSYDMRWD